MIRFFKSAALLFLPLVIWAAIVFIIDPFNYFNVSKLFSDASKKDAEKLNPHLYHTVDFQNHPCENILIGDSRFIALSLDKIETFSGKKHKKLIIHSAKLNEIYELIYLVNKRHPLKEAVIGINFNMFNEFGYDNRIAAVKRILNNPLLYIFNKDIVELCYYTVKATVTKEEVSYKPKMSWREFWKWNVEVKASHWYAKYEFPETLHQELIVLDEFCKDNGITLSFIIVPHHVEFHDRLVEFGLEDEEIRFKEIMAGLHAAVYDFDFPNAITTQKEQFSDPVHCNEAMAQIMVDDVWGGALKVGRKLEGSIASPAGHDLPGLKQNE